jgi:hypothetical protein
VVLNGLPQWVLDTGYVLVSYRVPKHGELFYAPQRDKIFVCEIPEIHEFYIVEYRGR